MVQAGRRLIFFFDGSSNRAAGSTDTIPTNVFRLNRAITCGRGDSPQINFYFAGVGTRRDSLSSITGRGFDEIVIEAYVNLASNYMPGDQIYLFGFSRGAAAARALSGMITNPGLLLTANFHSFPDLWKYFVTDPGEAKREQLRSKLRPLVNPAAKVKFLGAFDTVAGSSWDKKCLFTKVRFPNLHLDRCVDAAVQILAIDDDRNPSFSPLLWDGLSKARTDQKLEQIWMPGVHGDIGGSSDGRFLCHLALLTMVERAKTYCPELEWNDSYLKEVWNELRRTCPRPEITNERSDFLDKWFLFRGARSIGGNEKEFVHPVFKLLADREFTIRGIRQRYNPTNYNPLPVLGTTLDAEIAEICSWKQ
jgi:uncharacterized protein (DUF2235 family)